MSKVMKAVIALGGDLKNVIPDSDCTKVFCAIIMKTKDTDLGKAGEYHSYYRCHGDELNTCGWDGIQALHIPEFPDLGVSDIIGLLMSMLGVAAMRSYDKKNGIDTKK